MKEGSSSTGKGVIILLFLLVLAAVASSPLFTDGWFLSHDAVWHLDRLVAVTHEMDQGDYYPRWLSAGAFGKGLPVLNYYSPGIYLAAGYLHLLGVPLLLVLKLMCFSLFFLGSAGMFLWVRPHCGLYGALIAATIYTFVPYHFVDIYVRGAVPEFAGMALMPFLFYGIDTMFQRDHNFRGIVLTGASTALIMVTHNLTALMILPFAFLYFMWAAYSGRAPLKRILMSASGPLLGLGLSAFYWLPVLSEMGYLAHFGKSILAFSYSKLYILPSDWFSSRWGFGYCLPRTNDTMSFQVGYVLSAFTLISSLAVLFMRGEGGGFACITLALGILGLFLTVSPSSGIYEHIRVIQYVQFPWRYLGVATLFLAAFSGVSVNVKFLRRSPYGPLILLCLAFVGCLVLSQGQRTVRGRISGDIDLTGRLRIDAKNVGIMTAMDEYLPKWSSERVVPLKFAQIVSSGISTVKIDRLEARDSDVSFHAESKGESDLVVAQFYFPGWKATLDGKERPLSYTSDGLITIGIPPGRHSVRLWFGTTTPRIIGWSITFVTLLTLVFFKVGKKS